MHRMFPDSDIPKTSFQVPAQKIICIQIAAVEVVKNRSRQMLRFIPHAFSFQFVPVTCPAFKPFLHLGSPVYLERIKQLVRYWDSPGFVILRRPQLFEVPVKCAPDNDLPLMKINIRPFKRQGLTDTQPGMD